MRRSRTRVVLIAALATLGLAALVPATATAATHKLGPGKAVIALDPFVATFISAGYPFYPLGPASIAFDAPGPRVALPVTGGVWSSTPMPHGTFFLKGGLVWVHYASGPVLQTFTAPAWRAGILTLAGWTALINGARTDIFGESVEAGHYSAVVTIHGHKYLKVSNVSLDYSTDFTTPYNTAFGTTLSPGEPFGVATLLARLKK